MDTKREQNNSIWMGGTLAAGLAIGIGVGAALGNFGLGIAIGLILAVVIGAQGKRSDRS